MLKWALRRLPEITAGVVVVLVVAIGVAFAILLPLSAQFADQAKAGSAARDRSCALLPVARKMYADAAARNVIDQADLRLVYSTAAQVCGPQK